MSDRIAKLVTTSQSVLREDVHLAQLPLRIGRSPSVDISIDDRWVSREHCEFDYDGEMLVVRDLGSKHGTYVNGQMITQAQLHPGDEVSVGLTRFIAYPESQTTEMPRPEKAYA